MKDDKIAESLEKKGPIYPLDNDRPTSQYQHKSKHHQAE